VRRLGTEGADFAGDREGDGVVFGELTQGLRQRQGVLTHCVHGAPGLVDAVHGERAGPADGRGRLLVAAVVAQRVGPVQLQRNPGQRVAEHVVDLAGDAAALALLH
jgi:hypothetical protein